MCTLSHRERSLPAIVLVELRLPRALLGCFVGFSLGLAGAAMQGLLRNPLAEPGVVGVSGAAAFGAVVAFYTGLSSAFALALPLGGISGAIAAALDVLHQLRILHLLRGVARDGAGVVVVLHDLALATRFCDRLILLDGGRKVLDGPPEALTDEWIRRVYGVSALRGEHAGEPFVLPWSPIDERTGEAP